MSPTRLSQSRDTRGEKLWCHDWPCYVSSDKLEAALAKASQRASQYELEMRELEARLSESLSNFRAIDSLIQESYSALSRNAARAERALETQVPYINSELNGSLQLLSDLAENLPIIQTQLAEVRGVYFSGQEKAKTLVSELTWLNTEFYERWRRIIFTPSSPVSWRWKVVMRVLFALSLVICVYLFWLLTVGAYRAHRHRLVWGEKLIS